MLLISIALTLVSSFASPHARADDESKKSCFDFGTKIVTPMKAAPTDFTKDQSESQETEKTDIASVSGIVKKPIKELYEKLLDPKTIRNSDNTEVTLKTVDSKDYLKRLTQSIKVKVTFFMNIRWTEEWGFALKDGTADAPKSIVISFEKTDGTSHIDHLCGNMVLQSLSPTTTGVFIYEEMKASRRDAKDLLNDISGTLRTLRAEPEAEPKAEQKED